MTVKDWDEERTDGHAFDCTELLVDALVKLYIGKALDTSPSDPGPSGFP